MMHTKLTLIAIILCVSASVWSLDCTNHPLKPRDLVAGDWTNTSVVAPSNITFCKALAGKDVCVTPQGHKAMKAKFAAKKARFLAKRAEKLAQFKEMGDAYVKQMSKMVDVAADAVAEGASAAMLGMRLGLNMVEKWECGFMANGTLDMNNCPGMENPMEWIQKNGKNIRKDVLKRMIQIGMAILEAANGTDFDPNKKNPMRMLDAANNGTDPMPDFGDLNETMMKWMQFANLTTDKERVTFLKANRKLIAEVPFAKIRTIVRKMMKPEIKKAIMVYHAQKLAAFKAQRECFKRLLRVHTTMQCAKLNAVTNFAKKVGNKTQISVKRGAMANVTRICMQSVRHLVRMGEGWTEVEAEMYAISRYATAKKEWIKWKKMLNLVSKCDMKLNTLLRLVVYRIFEEGGLWDQGHAWERAELESLKKYIKAKKFFNMNIKVNDNCTNTTCAEVKAWVGVNGVSDDAADMANFKVKNPDNATLKDIDTNLDVFDKYEKAVDSPENEKMAGEWATAVLKALEGDMSLLEKLLNGTDPFNPKRQLSTRVLANEDVELTEVDDTDATAMAVGEDNQLDDAELNDVTEIDQADPTEQLEAVDNVSDADAGAQGDDSNTDDFPEDDEGSSKGTSFMTWVMYIGGAILVMALIAGVCVVLKNRKDADEFTHEQNVQDTEMSMPSGYHDNH